MRKALILLVIPFLMLGAPIMTNAQYGPVLTQETPFTNLKGNTFQVYNQTSGSVSTIHFNNDGTYIRILHGQQKLVLCPTTTEEGDKWTANSISSIVKMEQPNSLITTDHNGDIIRLQK